MGKYLVILPDGESQVPEVARINANDFPIGTLLYARPDMAWYKVTDSKIHGGHQWEFVLSTDVSKEYRLLALVMPS